MNRTANLVWSCVGLLTASLLSGCGSSVEKAQNNLAVGESSSSLGSLAAADLTKPLVTGAMAELMALNRQQSSDKAISAAELATYGSSSLLIDDPSGNAAGYLIFSGPGVEGDLWGALSKVDSKTALASGYFTALVSAQPMFSGVLWLEQGVDGLQNAARAIAALGGPDRIDKLILIDNMNLMARLKTGELRRLNATLTPVSEKELQDDILARQNFQRSRSASGTLDKVNANWSGWNKGLLALTKAGGVRESLAAQSAAVSLGQPVSSHLNYSALVQAYPAWKASAVPPSVIAPRSQRVEGSLRAQTIPNRPNRELGSASCGWFGICAYQYTTNISYYDAIEMAGGGMQDPYRYTLPDNTNYFTTPYKAAELLNSSIDSNSTMGCSAAALISMADWYWRKLGVNWYNYNEGNTSARAFYNYSNNPYSYPATFNASVYGTTFFNQTYVNSSGQTVRFAFYNHPGIRLGQKDPARQDRSEAMVWMQVRVSSGLGQNVTSNSFSGMINFLADQKQRYSAYLGAIGNAMTMHGSYNDAYANNVNGGTMAGILREAVGWQSLPAMVMYPLDGLAGHTSLVLNYSVYYPVGGLIGFGVNSVDHPNRNIDLANAFSAGIFSWY